jgi:hypothetical protein
MELKSGSYAWDLKAGNGMNQTYVPARILHILEVWFDSDLHTLGAQKAGPESLVTYTKDV